MSYLLYCIFHTSEHPGSDILLGVGGQPVMLLVNNGLCAAISRITPSDLTPDITRILAYEKVVDSFHRHVTVIPMRYGCLFDEQEMVSSHLEERRKHYQILLEEIQGCVEMGIRVLIPGSILNVPQSSKPLQLSLSYISQPKTPGQTYLTARQSYYAQEARYIEQVDRLLQQCHTALAGLFVRSTTEYPRYPRIRNLNSALLNSFLISLYFLVKRDSVASFREVFQEINLKESAKLLLSGPWPPYNFVNL